MANGIIPRPIPTVAYPDSPPLQYKGSPDFSLPRLDALDRRAGHGDRLNMKQEEGSGSTLEEIRNLEVMALPHIVQFVQPDSTTFFRND